jgi:uncharacterized protein (DUF1501 family)
MIRYGAGLVGMAGLGAIDVRRLAAAAVPSTEEPPTLVVLYLRGGADPINSIVPYGDPLYRNIRPTIAIPSPGELEDASQCVMPINEYFGFHPAMKPLAELWEAGRMVPIMNAGSTHPTRSHFDAQDFMERAAPGIKSVTEGWLNRYLYDTRSGEDGDLRAVSLQPTLPRSLRGQYPVLAVPDYGADEAMAAFERLYACDSNAEAKQKNAPAEAKPTPADASPEDQARQRILEAGTEGIAKLRHLNGILRGSGGSDAAYPDSHLARQFRDLAKVIKAGEGLEIAAIDYNGWDHHAFQGGPDGTHASMLGNISQTIKAFTDDLGPVRMQKTLVLCMSEFGRTVRENGNHGTDHGRGGYMMAIGGMVEGGRFYGDWTGLERQNLVDGRDLPVSRKSDFRLIFAEALHALFGFDTDEHDFFPDYKAREKPLGFLKPITA